MHMQDAAFLAALMGAAVTVPAAARSQSLSTGDGNATRRTPVAAHDIARGAVLGAGDIAWSDTVRVVRGALTVAPGWVARRPFRAGEPLSEPGVSRPDLVRTGDAVDVVYSAAGVTIRVRGTAIGNGADGDEVYVRLENRRRLRGVVAGANTVRVM